MIATGVQALVLAAATAMLPFTPPAGWVQMPQGAVGARVSNVWKGPHGATFSAVAFAFPGTAELLASAGANAARNTKILKTLSNKAVTLCGTPARMVTTRVQKGNTAQILQQEIATKGGYAYMLMYTRPAGMPASPQIAAVMRGFCPSATAEIAALVPPSGWTKSGVDMQTVGMWMGTHPGQVMVLLRGAQMKSLNDVFKGVEHQTTVEKSAKSLVKVTVNKSVSMCGYPGMLIDMEVNAGPMPAGVHMALTQGNGASYVLSYMSLGSSPADPVALAALKTLCVTGAPAPSASPAASASAVPSASPVPAATPTP